ncbi:unnamed protein product [Adineta steineri]|uniref:long-chain-fatty-acid--CoA ligase n=1 Tax=Adineta steineri TaxID=433720 RepID=A0A818SNB2_9BILA|nr:unnamed protein product [Adineta steineri]CAF3673303.1 unnamed protein product [Adineta steineri]
MLRCILKPNNIYTISFLRSISLTHINKSTYKARIQREHDDGIDINHQTTEIDSKEHIRRCTLHKDVDLYSYYNKICPNVRTLGDGLFEGCTASNDGPCMGYISPDDSSKTIQWLSYSQVIEKSRYIGSYLWIKTKLIPMKSKVAIVSSNRPEYLFVEQGCYMYGFLVVSLYTTFDAKTIMNLVKRTGADVLIVDNFKRIQSIKDDLLDTKQIKQIFVMDEGNYDEKGKIQSLSSIFKSMKTTDICERPTIDPQSIATYILTSGTTGDPKLAMISHENLLSSVKANLIRLQEAHVERPLIDRHCSFLPMAHVFERFVLLQIILRGTKFVYCPSPDKLIEYLSIVKPTQASVVPRIFNKIYDTVMADVNQSVVKRFLVRQALREQPSFLSRIVFRKVKQLFGGELKGIITSSAPLKPDIMHFFRIALDIPIIEAYGQTEASGGGTVTHIKDVSCGTVGTPMPSIEAKLVDVPDTNYRSENNQGEICFRGPIIFKGYYGDEEKTREAIDQDGWLHTGDVGEWTSTGALKIIDRMKHIFKLSQGKYIAPERLEDVYIRSSWVSQIFVDGISTEQSVVAIVIPDEDYVRKHFKSTSTNAASFADLCKDAKLKETIFNDLYELAVKNKLHSYETLSDIYIHPELFSQNNGLLTVTLKTRRTNARQHFGPILKSLYNVDSDVKQNLKKE